MRRLLTGFVAPLVAAVLLAVMLVQTRAALQVSGAWNRGRPTNARLVDPYAALDALVANAGTRDAIARDPFALAPVVSTVAPADRPAPRPVAPPPPARPVLTSIVWDNDPRATIRWDGRDYSVRENALFADYRVAGISRDQVVLERGGERIVLVLQQKGE